MLRINKKTFLHQLRSFFYAFSVTAAMYIAIKELHSNSNPSGFIVFTLALFGIYLIEIFSHWRTKSTKVQINFDIHDEINEFSHFFHKIVLPIIFYISLVAFGYYNIKSRSIIILLFFVFITFFVLFINIRAFFEHKLTVEHKTNYVYDIIKFLIFFAGVDSLSNLANFYQTQLIPISIGVFALSFTLLFLMLWRYKKLRQMSAFFSFVASFLIAAIFFISQTGRIVNALQISLSLIFIFYLSAAIIHHKLMRTLTRSVLVEYFVVMLLVLAITYGIS